MTVGVHLDKYLPDVDIKEFLQDKLGARSWSDVPRNKEGLLQVQLEDGEASSLGPNHQGRLLLDELKYRRVTKGLGGRWIRYFFVLKDDASSVSNIEKRSTNYFTNSTNAWFTVSNHLYHR